MNKPQYSSLSSSAGNLQMKVTLQTHYWNRFHRQQMENSDGS